MEYHKFNADRLVELIEKNHITKKKFCSDVMLSPTTLANIVAKENYEIGANRLAIIADYFGVSMDYFFDREDVTQGIGHQVQGNCNNVSGDIIISQQAEKIEHLMMLLDEKERTIQILLNKSVTKQK